MESMAQDSIRDPKSERVRQNMKKKKSTAKNRKAGLNRFVEEGRELRYRRK